MAMGFYTPRRRFGVQVSINEYHNEDSVAGENCNGTRVLTYILIEPTSAVITTPPTCFSALSDLNPASISPGISPSLSHPEPLHIQCSRHDGTCDGGVRHCCFAVNAVTLDTGWQGSVLSWLRTGLRFFPRRPTPECCRPMSWLLQRYFRPHCAENDPQPAMK